MADQVMPFHIVGEGDEVTTKYTDQINKLRATFASGRTRNHKWRIQQLNQLQQFLEDNTETLLAALGKDLKKNKMEGLLFEVEFAINDVKGALMEIDDWVRNEPVAKSPMTILDTPYICSEPFGVTLVLGAWNYPVQILLCPLIGAIAAGNCAVLKPSELSPACAAIMENLVPKYLDPDAFLVINGGVAEATELLKERFDFIFYTGSINVGKIVYDAAHKYLTPVALELGGKSPVYLDANVDIDIATKRILWGKYVNAGQTCVAPDYILCHEAIHERFVENCKKVIKEFYGDDPKQSADYGRIVSPRHAKRLEAMLENADVVFGGEVDADNRYVAPTVLSNVKVSDPIMKEEIFGPILPIIKVKDITEAVDFINARDKPLTAYVFSKSSGIVERFISETSSGSVCANDVIVHLSVDTLPFGGVGQSGFGRYHGKASFDCFSNKKSVLIRDFNPIGEMLGSKRYPPITDGAISLFRSVLAKRSNPFGCVYNMVPYAIGAALGIGATVLYRYWTTVNRQQ